MAKIETSIIKDTLELTDIAGNVKSVPIVINCTKIMDAVTKQRIVLSKLTGTENTEELGKQTVNLFSLLFGESATDEILKYYEDDYYSMIADIAPYVADTVFPVFDRMRSRAVNSRKKIKR